MEKVEEGLYFDLVVGPPVSKPWEGCPRVFQVVNKEFNVICEETVSEMSARYYLNHYEQSKATYVNEGLQALIGEPQGPETRHG